MSRSHLEPPLPHVLSLQMVGVSDDVNEYALALKDTEEKIKRCPKRVSTGASLAVPLLRCHWHF